MIWKILRPHYWMLDRKLRQTNRLVVVGLIALLAFTVQWLCSNLIGDKLANLSPELAASLIGSFLPVGLLFLLSIAVLGVGDVMHQLYLASDLDLLMVAPIPQQSIFLAKLLQCSRAMFIPAIGLGAVFSVLGLVQKAAPSYYLLIAAMLLMGMLLSTSTVMILVMSLARILPARAIRSWMPVAFTLIMFAIAFGQQWVMQRFSAQPGLINLLAEASANPGQLALIAFAVSGLALLTSYVAYRIFDRTFHGGWDRLREVPALPKPDANRRRKAPRLMRAFPMTLRSLLAKEWLELRRDPQGLMNLAVVFIIILMLFLLPVMLGGTAFEALHMLLFWFMLMLIVLLLTLLPVGMTMMSMAREGRNIFLLRSAPISMLDMLKGKFWALWTPMALMWLLVILVAGIWLKFQAWQIGALEAVTILGLSGTSLVALAMGGLKVDFEAEDLQHRIPTLAGYLTMAINGIFMLMASSGMAWIIVRLFPGDPVVFVVQALSGFTAVEWILSDAVWVPVALVGSQALFWIGLKLMWNAAVRRLESYEGA